MTATDEGLLKLAECPFCGKPGAICCLEDEIDSPAGFWINCSCGVETVERRTEAEAVEHWNTRNGTPALAQAAGMRDDAEADLADLAELTDGHLALDRLGAAREMHGCEVAICERINEIGGRLTSVAQAPIDRETLAKTIQQYWQGPSGRAWDGHEKSCCEALPGQADWFRRLADHIIASPLPSAQFCTHGVKIGNTCVGCAGAAHSSTTCGGARE